jgi:hypothetical protein
MPMSQYFIKIQHDIQATKDEKSRQMEAISYRYVSGKMYVQPDRHGRSSLCLDGYKN